ncbi:putative ribonuclease H-like domain-containing protein [Tanacetum coccineum]
MSHSSKNLNILLNSQTSDRDKAGLGQETHESMLELVVNEPKVVSQSKVWYDTPIIEEYESDSEDEHLVLLGEKGKLLLSPQQVVIGDTKDITGTKSPNTMVDQVLEIDYPQRALQNKGIVDSGCSRHMTGNKAYLAEYQDFNGGPVAFGGSKGYITGKGKIKTGKLDFEDVCFVKELQHFNLFSVSQMCDKKNKVLFTDTECLVLSPEFKLPDENQVLLRIPRQNNMYSFNLENIVPSGGLACLIAKATIDESNKWHRRLGHVNFKNLNKLVKGNLVRGLPSKIFQNDHTCVACQKGKQHKASCKAKSVSSISQPLQLLHMDLFGPTSVRSLNHKTYCLVITDDFSRFSWVFFLRTKDETSGILKDFIRQIENQLNQKVKTIRCDNGTEFKNRDFIEFYGSKRIKREYNSFLPNTFWAEAVSTACYVLNRVLVTKPQNKTPYELITGKIPIISYIRPFGCHVTILNTIDHLGKFDRKSDEGFLVGYSLNNKAFRVYNLETKRVEENLHITFLENKPNVAGKGPNWLFDLDYLTDSMNYQPVRSENQANKHASLKEANHSAGLLILQQSRAQKQRMKEANDAAEALRKEFAQDTKDLLLQAGDVRASSTNTVNTTSTPVSTASPFGGLSFTNLTNTDQDDSEIPALKDSYDNPNDGIFTNASYDDEGAGVSDLTSPIRTLSVNVSPIPTSRINSIHPSTLILRDPQSAVQTRSKVTKSSGAHAFLVAQGHKQEEGINYDEVFAPVAKIEAIRIFLAFDSYMGFMVYQMDVKSAFLYGKIDEEVDVVLNSRKELVDILFLKKGQTKDILYTSYVDDIIFGSTKKSWCDEFEALVKSRFQMSSIRELTFSLRLQVKQKEDGIFISQDKYVAEILKKFDFASVKTASTPIETQKPLVKDEEASDVDVTTFIESMIGSLMYLKGKPKLGLWYPRLSSFDLQAYLDSDYAGENLDRKSTTGGCQFLGRRLISWQCKKQTIVATSTTKAPLQKEKGVELKDVENIERPRLTSTRSLLTLKSLLKIDPKDKGKKKIKEDESDTESEDINETKKKFKMLAHDEEIARKMQEDWETEEERKRLAEEEATNAALIQDFDNIKVRMEADRLLA